MPARTGRFGRSDRVLRTVDYRRVSRQAERFRSPAFVLLVAPMWHDPRRREGSAPQRRIGITVSRKVGNAVARNHVKRRVREWFRSRRESLAKDADLVVIARPGAASLDSSEIFRSLDQALAQPASRGGRRRPPSRTKAGQGKSSEG